MQWNAVNAVAVEVDTLLIACQEAILTAPAVT